jgi:hypothetical protein
LAVDEFLHVVIRQELTHLPVAANLEKAQFLRSPGISRNAFNIDEGGRLTIERGAVEAEIDSQMRLHPLPGASAALIAVCVEGVAELPLEEVLRLLLGNITAALHEIIITWMKMSSSSTMTVLTPKCSNSTSLPQHSLMQAWGSLLRMASAREN